MLVSGGKIIAIDGVNTTSATLSGDGVFTPLGVNTSTIATTGYVKTKDDEIKNTLSSVSSTLSSAIDKKQDQLEFGYNSFDKINKINGSALAAGNNVIVSAGDDNVHVQSATEGENTIYSISITANPTDVSVSGEHGLSAKKVPGETQTNFTLGLTQTAYNAVTSVSSKLDTTAFSTVSGKFLTAVPGSALWEKASKEVTSHSANWNNSYITLTSNSADWLKEDDITGLATKVELNTASSTLTGQTHYLSGKIDGITADVDYLSGQIDNKLDKSIYANASGKWENASDKVEASSNFWNSVYDTVNDNSAKWDGVAESANYWNLTYNEFTANSGNWNETTQKVIDSADTWNTVTAKANSADLEELSGKVETLSSNVEAISSNLDKKLDKDDFTAWSSTIDTAFYSAGEGLALDNHTFSISAKYLSANALDDVSGNWNSVYNTVSSNSANWDNLTAINTFSSIGGVSARNSADELLFEQGDNVSITTANNTITFSAKDTTYDENDFISASHLDNIVSVSATVKSNSANWNDVSSKANSADLTALSSKVNNLSSELNTTSSFLSGAIGDVSAEFEKVVYTSATANWDVTTYSAGQNINITDHTISGKDWTDTIKEASANAVTTVENKFNGENNTITAYGTSSFANDKYTAGDGLALNDHQFYVSGKYITSAGDILAGKMLILKDNEWIEMPEFGGFATANSGEGHPDVQNPSTKLIYLVKNSSVTGNDKYSEWIYTSADAQTTAWECIGDTSLDLTPYLTKDEASATYQKKLIAGNYIDITNNTISVSGLHNTTLTSTNDSVGITSTTDASGNIQYDLGVNTIPSISGINGVSAYYDETEDQYIVGLDDYNDIGFAKYSSSANVYTASAVVDGYTEDLNVNPTKITLDKDKILLKTGFYHVDVQTNFTISKPDNNYYNVFVKSIPNAASITQMIDGSYAHTETVDLSFDIRITSDDTPLKISVEYFKTNETFAISNLNIHEIVSMPSQIEGGAGNYQAGNGISLGNDTIAAKIGNGLEFNESNAIQVKLGEGLAFTDDQGIKAISIDPAGDVAEVVKSVEALQDELDTKITDNFPPAMITLADLQVATGTQYAPSNGGMLIGYLFTCPITHNIYVDNEKYQTKIGIYTKQWSGDNKKVILGIYEYDPDYNEGGQVGKTEALCDTGIIELQQGYAEYEIKNVGEKTTPIMTPGKFYYATIYLSYLAGDTNGITLFGAPGYNTQVNNLKPGITITNVNCIRASLYDNMTGYDQDLNFDKMGFSWEYNSYPPDASTQTTSQGIVEAHAAGRPYFAIRNVKKVTGN